MPRLLYSYKRSVELRGRPGTYAPPPFSAHLIARDDHAHCRLHRHRRFDRISAGQAMTAADYAILGVLVAVPVAIFWYALRQQGLY